VRFGIPPGRLEFRNDELAAGVGFVRHVGPATEKRYVIMPPNCLRTIAVR
jgi:hypothetical protein